MSNQLTQDIVTHTNERILSWYKTVKENYGVEGKAHCTYSELEKVFIIKGIEDGKTTTKEYYFHEDYAHCGISKIFDIWSADF